MLEIFIKDAVPWILSAFTICINLLAGNKNRNAWIVGLFAQILWLSWISYTKTWGFLPMNLALWIIYARNYLKWSK
jgi:hypothetical protein